MRVMILQHGPWGAPGVIGRRLRERGVDLDVRRVDDGDEVPEDPPEALIVLGGQMCTDEADRYPFLARERDLLGKCVASDTPTLGICLGAQLLAEATGGTVRHGVPEIGYPAVQLTDEAHDDPVMSGFPRGTRTFNAHRDYITAGPEAVVLAWSDRAPVHAFRVQRRAYGVQFHPEMDAAQVERYASAEQPGAYLRRNGWQPEDLIALARRHNANHVRVGRALTDRWFALS